MDYNNGAKEAAKSADSPDAQADPTAYKAGADYHKDPSTAADPCGRHEPGNEKGQDHTRPQTRDDHETAPAIRRRRRRVLAQRHDHPEAGPREKGQPEHHQM